MFEWESLLSPKHISPSCSDLYLVDEDNQVNLHVSAEFSDSGHCHIIIADGNRYTNKLIYCFKS